MLLKEGKYDERQPTGNTHAVREQYLLLSKKEKGGILDEFTRVTGYHRKAVIRLRHRRGQSTIWETEGISYDLPEQFAVFPPVILDTISTDWLLKAGNDLLAHNNLTLNCPVFDLDCHFAS